MRTAAICPTCATYTNAVCVLYDGPYLSNLDIAPLTDLEEVIGIIDAKVGTLQPALGFTPENVANKSTNVSLGTSNTLYPTQNAVKTYVDTEIAAIPVPDLQQVTNVGNSTTFPIYVQDDPLTPNVTVGLAIDTVITGEPYVIVQNLGANKTSILNNDKLSFSYGTGGTVINTTNLSGAGNKNIELPNASGNLALSVNGIGANTSGNIAISYPNKVYVAVISMVDGSVINLLKNTLGDTLTWVASSGVIATSSTVLASEANTFVSVTSGSTTPKIVSTNVAVSSLSWNVSIYQTDNAGVPNSTDFVYVEIRIY
jgi:hypothetical protein